MVSIKQKLASLSNRIKDLFKEENSEEVSLDNIDKWFEGRIVPIQNEVNKGISSIKGKIKEEINATKENLGLLGKAELRNKREAPRIIQIMLDNREAYIKKITAFVDSIVIPDTVDEINNFTMSFGNSIDSLNKSTIRSYFVLREFVEHEAYRVAQNLKKIDELVKELDFMVNKREVVLVNSVRRRIPELKNKIGTKEKLRADKEKAETELRLKEIEEKNVHDNIKKFKKSKEYSNYEKLNDELEHFVTRLQSHNNDLYHHFAVLERALKKYSKISMDEELITTYLTSPAKALVNDTNFKIIDILQQVKKFSAEDKIELKDKKKEKSIQTVELLNKEFLMTFLDRHKQLTSQIGEINKEIDASPVIKEMEAFEKQLKEAKDKKDAAERDFNTIKADIDKMNIDDLKEMVESNINQLLEGNVKLVF